MQALARWENNAPGTLCDARMYTGGEKPCPASSGADINIFIYPIIENCAGT